MNLHLSPMLSRRLAVAASVFAAAFFTSYLSARGGVGTDAVYAGFAAGVAALAHWAANQVAPVVEAPRSPPAPSSAPWHSAFDPANTTPLAPPAVVVPLVVPPAPPAPPNPGA